MRKSSAIVGMVIALSVLGLVGVLVWSATIFEDDFSPPKPGWLIGTDPFGNGTWSVVGGEYQVLVSRPRAISSSFAPVKELSEFCVESAMKIMGTSARGSEVGLAVAGQGAGQAARFLTFGIFTDGAYRLGRFTAGKIEDLPVTTAPVSLRPAGLLNTLKVVAQGSTLHFYANDQLLATAQQSPSGRIGFFGRAGRTPFAIGRFDYIRIMTPDCKP
jgi:hypothetical protein